MIEWEHPQALYFILPVTAVWLAASLYARSRRNRAAAAFVSGPMRARILPHESAGRSWLKTALLAMTFIFGLLGLARPRWGVYYETVHARGSDIYVIVDVSRSMLANDVLPSRLGRAKADVQGLLSHLKGERVGLIAFAGVAAVKCPLTSDYNFVRLALDELSPNSVARGGTAIGDAIRKALEVLPKVNDRDQALLLITDGDDQQSYPMEAAAAAAERSVAIFTVGLGDVEQGAQIPVGEGTGRGFVQYKGESVVSKMDENLLKNIALKTQGAYVPARTQAYDLGKLYADHLATLRGAEGGEQKRSRLSEQYQWFLAFEVLCLLAELSIRLHDPSPERQGLVLQPVKSGKKTAKAISASLLLYLAISMLGATPSRAIADEARQSVQEGLDLYKKDDFEGAKNKFTKASEDESKLKREEARNHFIAFDLGCALQRKGDTEHAREQYLKAALSADKVLAAAAHFNMGCMTSEAARTLAGEHPENIKPEKRQEILDKLLEAVGSFRSCLELQPGHADARKNIELIRMWIKLYTDKWRELDKQKQREESNLIQFLEYIIETEKLLQTSVSELGTSPTLDVLAEHKQAQQEILDEIEPLKEKIRTSLTPPPTPPGQQPPADPKDKDKEKENAEAIKTLISWADTAAEKMRSSNTLLDARQAKKAASEQKLSIAELERIWEAVVPFEVLLAHELADQTSIVEELKPPDEPKKADDPFSKAFDWFKNMLPKTAEAKDNAAHAANAAAPAPAPGENKPPAKVEVKPAIGAEWADLQEKTARRGLMLKPKAEMELQQAEKMPPQPPAQAPAPPSPGTEAKPAAPDPEKIKAGLKKAIELSPKAVEHMDLSGKALRKSQPDAAYPDAEEARKILDEILKAQPRIEQKKQEQDKKDQQKKDQEKKEQEKKDQEKKDSEKKDQDQKKDKDQQDKDKKDSDKDKGEKKEQDKEKKPMSKEQAEAMLRKVREREQDHRNKKEAERIRGMGGMTVDKDW